MTINYDKFDQINIINSKYFNKNNNKYCIELNLSIN